MAMSIRQTTTIARTGRLSVVSKNQSEESLLTDLFSAYYCARKNKRNTSSQLKFERNLSENMVNLYEDILSYKYKVGRSMCFIIHDPVCREVFAASFRDRIVHHLLYNWLMPLFEPTFIYDSYSCRVGKGTLFGIKRLEHHLRSCSENYTRECYILKLDIEGYFMNINRQRLYDLVVTGLLSMIAKTEVNFDVQMSLYLLAEVIFNAPTVACYIKGDRSEWRNLPRSKSLFYAPEGCGLPIGNLTSQLFSNIYLTPLDNYVKRDLKFRHYGRYVDDFYIIDKSKERLLQSIEHIRNFLLAELGLKLHPHKVFISSLDKGLRFLGAAVKPYRCYICKQGLKRAHSHLLEVLTEEVNPYEIRSVLKSYEGYASHFHNSVFLNHLL